MWLGSGGGIVADSDDDAEYRECLLKAAPLIRALGATLREEPGAPVPIGSGPAASRPRCGPGPRGACSPRSG